MLLQGFRKVGFLGVNVGVEEIVVGVVRIECRVNGFAARIADRASRQTGALIGIIRGIQILIVGFAVRLDDFFHILGGGVGLEQRILGGIVQTIPEYGRDRRHLLGVPCLCLDHRCQRNGLIQRNMQSVHAVIHVLGDLVVEVPQNLLADQFHVHFLIECIGIGEQIALHLIELFVLEAGQVVLIGIAELRTVVKVIQKFVGIADVVFFQQICGIYQTHSLRKCHRYRQRTVHGITD